MQVQKHVKWGILSQGSPIPAARLSPRVSSKRSGSRWPILRPGSQALLAQGSWRILGPAGTDRAFRGFCHRNAAAAGWLTCV